MAAKCYHIRIGWICSWSDNALCWHILKHKVIPNLAAESLDHRNEVFRVQCSQIDKTLCMERNFEIIDCGISKSDTFFRIRIKAAAVSIETCHVSKIEFEN